ncbi:hypothetical protein AV530_015719 [Patagioenas fasciata monilis]|uniref:Uncharacterized protein n=1 Tax=Patagioenas fasciata monilis TaxID=372326 RepID=A0A1V4KIL4_PATFA|nr:hypothetical protein AV530_015719 [Patagioenas fasciata monilis]
MPLISQPAGKRPGEPAPWGRARRDGGGAWAAAEDKQPWLAMTLDLNTSSLDFRSTSIPIPSQAGGIM